MFKVRLLVGMGFLFLTAMVWIDWNFPTYMFYSPVVRRSETFATMYLFKKGIELGLSLFLIAIAVVVLRLKQSGHVEKFLASVAIGMTVGYWLHRDLIFLLFNQ